jgi:hypothetical protein
MIHGCALLMLTARPQNVYYGSLAYPNEARVEGIRFTMLGRFTMVHEVHFGARLESPKRRKVHRGLARFTRQYEGSPENMKVLRSIGRFSRV